MKRFAIYAVALACAFGAQAQTNQKLERVGFMRDSVADVLAEQRAKYSKNEALRQELAPAILKLEKELAKLQSEYDNEVALIAQQDIKGALTAYDDALKTPAKAKDESAVVEESKTSTYAVDKSRQKRDLVANDFFAERLSPTDYKALLDAQKREAKLKAVVEKYFSGYGTLLSRQREYMEAPTKREADSVTTLFIAQTETLSKIDEEITSASSSLFYNKIYAYDLLMERDGNTSMLDFSAEAVGRAEREINENSDQYQSDALVAYFARKKALTEYEMKIASTLSLSISRDSLKTVMSELKNRDYRLSKLSLQRRSFIEYEDIKVKTPTVYNSKNPVPRTKVYDYGTVYRIRIGLFSKRPNISALRGVMPLSYSDSYNGNMIAYFVGGFRTEQEAKEGVTYLKKLGFKEPIVAVWVDGEYYSTLEDMRRSQSLYNIEISGVATLTEEMKAKILSHKGDCSISRIGTTFVVGTFDGKSSAEAVATELKVLDSNVVVKISKKTN